MYDYYRYQQHEDRIKEWGELIDKGHPATKYMSLGDKVIQSLSTYRTQTLDDNTVIGIVVVFFIAICLARFTIWSFKVRRQV